MAYAQVFKEESIENDSDFFDLGGDSLSMVALCTFLEGRLDCEVHPSLLLYHPTVEELAGELDRVLSEGAERS